MRYNSEYLFFDKLMSIFGFKMVNLYKRLTPKCKVPFALYEKGCHDGEYQIHLEQQSVYAIPDDIYNKFLLIFRILMLKHNLRLQSIFAYNDKADKFRYFLNANYVIKDRDSLETVSEVSLCSIDTLGDFDVLNNDIFELVELWMTLDNNDIPYDVLKEHLTGTYEQVLLFAKNQTMHTSTMGEKEINFMKLYNISKGILFLMTSKESLELIVAMKKLFNQNDYKIPEIHILLKSYFVDIVLNSLLLIVDKLRVKTVGEEMSYSLNKYKEQWLLFENRRNNEIR